MCAGKASSKTSQDATLAHNRRARFDFEITDQVEAGLVLLGTEVKSARAGGAVLSDAYVQCRNGQALVLGLKIAPYSHGNRQNHDPTRTRVLLLHRSELARLEAETRAGLQLIPLRLYLKNGIIKLEVGVARPRKSVDKRHLIKDREDTRDMRRAMSRRGRGDED